MQELHDLLVVRSSLHCEEYRPPDELVKVVVTRELPQVVAHVGYILSRGGVLLKGRLELLLELLVGDGLIPDVLKLVVEGLQREDVEHLLKNGFLL